MSDSKDLFQRIASLKARVHQMQEEQKSFKKSSECFLDGIGSIWGVDPSRSGDYVNLSRKYKAQINSFPNDWEVVGNDFRSVLSKDQKRFKLEHGE